MNVQVGQAIPFSSSSFSFGEVGGARSTLGEIDTGRD
jgi:hypothetical protein